MQLRIPQLTSNQHQTQQHKDLSKQHGDDITNKKSSHTRLAFQNAHGIDRQQPHSLPTEIIQQYKIDIFGIAETNCKWDDDIIDTTLKPASNELSATQPSPPHTPKHKPTQASYQVVHYKSHTVAWLDEDPLLDRTP